MGLYNACKSLVGCPFCHQEFTEYFQYKWGLLALVTYSVGDRIAWDPQEVDESIAQASVVRGAPVPWLLYFSIGTHRTCKLRISGDYPMLEDYFPAFVEIKEQKIIGAHTSLTDAQAEIFLEQTLRQQLIVLIVPDFVPPIEIQLARLALLSEHLANLYLQRVCSDAGSFIFLNALGHLALYWMQRQERGVIGSAAIVENIIRCLHAFSRGKQDERKKIAEAFLLEIRSIPVAMRNREIWPKIEGFL